MHSTFFFFFFLLWEILKEWKALNFVLHYTVLCYYLVSFAIIDLQYLYSITFPVQKVPFFTPCIFIYTFSVLVANQKGLLFSHPASDDISKKWTQFSIQTRSSM